MKIRLKELHKNLAVILPLGAITLLMIWLPTGQLIFFQRIEKQKNKSSIDKAIEDNDPIAIELEKIYRYHEKLNRLHNDLYRLSAECSSIISRTLMVKGDQRPKFPSELDKLNKYYTLLFEDKTIHDFKYRKFDFFNTAFYPPKDFRINRAVRLIKNRYECNDYQIELIDHSLEMLMNNEGTTAQRQQLLSKILKGFQEHLRTVTNAKELHFSNEILKKISESQIIDPSYQYPILNLNDEISYYLEEIDFEDAEYDPKAENSPQLFAFLKAEYEMSRTYSNKIEELIRDISVDMSYPI
jgi:hypothetical protein